MACNQAAAGKQPSNALVPASAKASAWKRLGWTGGQAQAMRGGGWIVGGRETGEGLCVARKWKIHGKWWRGGQTATQERDRQTAAATGDM